MSARRQSAHSHESLIDLITMIAECSSSRGRADRCADEVDGQVSEARSGLHSTSWVSLVAPPAVVTLRQVFN